MNNQSLRSSILLIGTTTLAYGLDYLFNIASARLLTVEAFGILVALTGIGHVMIVGSRIIQTVVTRYVSHYQAHHESEKIAAFTQSALNSAWIGGAILTLALLPLSGFIADFLQLPKVTPVILLLAATLLMVVRPVAGGILQGQQRFELLGWVQVVQAIARFGVGVLLMWWGLSAEGAIASLLIASGIALLFNLWRLQLPRVTTRLNISFSDLFHYSAYTTAGLFGHAVLVNMDAILVKRFFDETTAGNYGSAVTLGKVIQFFPIAITMILFSKTSQRHATQRNTAKIVLIALLIVGIACGAITILYFIVPTKLLIGAIFGKNYEIDNTILGLIGCAMLTLSLMNVWVNYFLSIDNRSYVYLVWLGVIGQSIGMAFFHQQLWQLPLNMAVTGLILTIAGGVLLALQRSKHVS